MKKELLSLGIFLFISAAAYGQVGINTPSPNATFDIVAKKPTGTSTDVDGLLAPRVDRERAQLMTGVGISTLIYVNDISTGTQTGTAANIDTEGYYYFNGTAWVKSDTDTNIYNSDGTLTGNRVVSQGANTLAFKGTATNAFSVDGSTFSVDAANHRVGVGTVAPSSILSVLNSTPGNLVDAFIAGVNNCGSPCGQGTARNVVLYNENGTNSTFAGIDFVAAQTPTAASGASIYGIDRDATNNYAGLSFATRNATDFGARLTIKSAGNVGVGTETPNASAALEVSSTTKGFLPPRLNTDQRDAINPRPAGLIIYNTTVNCMQYWNGTTWAGNCEGEEAGTVVSITCSSAVFSPATFTQGTTYTGTLTVPYTGGNGGTYSQTSFSQNGLTFTLPAGTLINGDGNLVFNVAGTPSTAGAMSIPISFGGTSCNVNATVTGGTATVVSLTCSSAVFSPVTLTQGTAYTGTLTVPYTGGNGGTYSQTSFNQNGLTFTLPAGTLASTGNLVYNVAGTPSTAGAMSIPISFGGVSCNVSATVAAGVGTIATLECSTAVNNGTLIRGVSASGVSSVISYTGGNGGNHSGQTVQSTGVTGLTATLLPGSFNNGTGGTLTYTITGNPSGSGTAKFAINIGGKTCDLERTVANFEVYACTTEGRFPIQNPAAYVVCVKGTSTYNPDQGDTINCITPTNCYTANYFNCAPGTIYKPSAQQCQYP